MSNNKNLGDAKTAKQDEFYTQLRDIEEEMQHYRGHFTGKVVLCNCDDPVESNFFKFFANSFEFLGLKKLIAVCYNGNGGRGRWLEYDGDKNGNKTPDPEEIGVHELEGDGDFRSPECIEFLKQADIVVTNPPFSLFREYVAQLMKYDKKFIILGSMNALTYKEVFPLFQANKIWYGWNCGGMDYIVPRGYKQGSSGYWEDAKGNAFFHMGNTRWFTNLDHKKRHKELILVKRYKKNPELYPKYDNYDAINVDKYKGIPEDYDGMMGVPISFMDHYCPEQFEIIGIANRGAGDPALRSRVYTKDDYPNYSDLNVGPTLWVNGKLKNTYSRLLIRRKKH